MPDNVWHDIEQDGNPAPWERVWLLYDGGFSGLQVAEAAISNTCVWFTVSTEPSLEHSTITYSKPLAWQRQDLRPPKAPRRRVLWS